MKAPNWIVFIACLVGSLGAKLGFRLNELVDDFFSASVNPPINPTAAGVTLGVALISRDGNLQGLHQFLSHFPGRHEQARRCCHGGIVRPV